MIDEDAEYWHCRPPEHKRPHHIIKGDWDAYSYHLRNTPEGLQLILEKKGEDYMAICTEDTWKILEDLLAENKYAITEMILELKR